MFSIEDELHAESQGDYVTFEEAVAELKRRSLLPWNEWPNVAPCTSWKTCGRNYEIIEYDTSITPWKEIRRIPALEIRAEGIKWFLDENEE
jgi:hypothetical protein